VDNAIYHANAEVMKEFTGHSLSITTQHNPITPVRPLEHVSSPPSFVLQDGFPFSGIGGFIGQSYRDLDGSRSYADHMHGGLGSTDRTALRSAQTSVGIGGSRHYVNHMSESLGNINGTGFSSGHASGGISGTNGMGGYGGQVFGGMGGYGGYGSQTPGGMGGYGTQMSGTLSSEGGFDGGLSSNMSNTKLTPVSGIKQESLGPSTPTPRGRGSTSGVGCSLNPYCYSS
jgi:hypothetical protein